LIQQGRKKLFTTSLTVEDFMITGFYTIDKLDAHEDAQVDKGFQRILQEDRAKRLAKYMVESWKKNREAFLPSSIFMATDKDIEFDSDRNEIHFDMSICPFSVVDGQHRIEGLKQAALIDESLKSFPVPVNIAVNLEPVEQMLHFYVVNTTQRPVDPAVGNRILARLHHMRETEDLPYIPSWMKRRVGSDADAAAISIVARLNSDDSSPWRGKIQLANQPKNNRSHTITEKFLVSVIKKNILSSGHALKIFDSEERRNRIFISYWNAVASKFTTEETKNNTVVFKSTGAWFFTRLSDAMIGHAKLFKSAYRVTDFEEIFDSVKENLPPDSDLTKLTFPDWWKSGGEASGWNRSAADRAAIEFSQQVENLASQYMNDFPEEEES